MTERFWHGLAPMVVTGVIMATSSHSPGQAQSGANSELVRIEFMLEDTQYLIWVLRNSRLEQTRTGCAKIWHPRSKRLMKFLELCPVSGANPPAYSHQTTLTNGARVRYHIDRDIGGGSGGPEGELKGEVELGGKVLVLRCRDQSEWENTPDWCLQYLRYLENKGAK
jgi:hypothetical protein